MKKPVNKKLDKEKLGKEKLDDKDKIAYREFKSKQNINRDVMSSMSINPELEHLAFNPYTDGYLPMNELKDKTDSNLVNKLLMSDLSDNVGTGEIILNYDLQFKKQLEEIEKLKQLNGDMMDEKDIQLLKRDLEESFAKGMAEIINKVDTKITNLDTKFKSLDKQAEQTCKDGNCTIKAIKDLKENINSINTINGDKINELETNITKLNIDKANESNKSIEEINKKIDGMCTGIDCLKQIYEDKENTVPCPVCKREFIWNNQTHCPFCDTPIEPDT